MRLTLRELLSQQGLQPENTVYRNTSNSVLDYPFAASNASFTMIRMPEDGGWGLLLEKQLEMKQLYGRGEYTDILAELNSLKEAKPQQPEFLRELRARRKGLKARLNELEVRESGRLDQKLFGVDAMGENALLCYKDYLYAANLHELAERISPLKNLMDSMIKGPVFTRETGRFADAVQGGRRFAVLGGPCLFGAYEVELCFALRDGKRARYDFTTGVPYNEETEWMFPFDDVQDFIFRFGSEITDLRFFLHKSSLTTQESEAMEYVLRMASLFSSRAYIPLPDMSYRKYLASILRPIARETVRKNALGAFRELAYDQTDLFLARAQQLLQNYPGVELTVLHEREKDMMQVYMEKRAGYLKRFASRAERLTKRSAWADSIRDYITMPALPLYMDGIHDVIEADTLDEAESGRKCQKLHNGDLVMHPLFFPEPISANGVQSMFYAPLSDKEYLSDPSAAKEYSL